MVSPAAGCVRRLRISCGATAPARRTAPARKSERSTRGPRSARTPPMPCRSMPCASPDVGFVVVELEVDLRAEHLQVGNKRIGFGDALRIAVEVARLRPRVALDERIGA